jgi:hypothetical protein
MPDYLPLPVVPRAELKEARDQRAQEFVAARRRPLAYEIRAVGEGMRQLGRLVHEGETINVDRRNRLCGLVRAGRTQWGDEQVKQLRAAQAQLFIAALGDWERTGVEGSDLIELGGDFLAVATKLGWLPPDQKQRLRALKLDQDERAALFLTRWTDLTCLTDDPALRLQSVWPVLALRARLKLPIAALGEADLTLLDRVKRLDPDYPDLLAKGLIYVRSGKPARAAEAFRTHLQLHADGPYALRARNHLIFALAELNRHAE